LNVVAFSDKICAIIVQLSGGLNLSKFVLIVTSTIWRADDLESGLQELPDVNQREVLKQGREGVEGQRYFLSSLDVALRKDDDEVQLVVEDVRRVRRARVTEQGGSRA
jgi:hypothetical protein